MHKIIYSYFNYIFSIFIKINNSIITNKVEVQLTCLPEATTKLHFFPLILVKINLERTSRKKLFKHDILVGLLIFRRFPKHELNHFNFQIK